MSILIKNVDEDKMDRLAKFGGEVKEEDYTSYLPISTDKLVLADNWDVIKLAELTDPEWTKEVSSEEFEDFADAVAGIPADGQMMQWRGYLQTDRQWNSNRQGGIYYESKS